MKPEAFGSESHADRAARRADEVPMELIGIARPFTPADRRELDLALGLGEVAP